MLDTVAIRITYPNFMVGNPNLFTPALIIQDKVDFNYGRNRFQKFIQNPTHKDKLTGTYFPRLTVYKRFDDFNPTYDLHIEFSVPKLLNGNSVQEYDDTDFDKVISELKSRLAWMEIRVFEVILRQAIVAKAHFGKNIVLPHPLTVQDAISTLYKADVGRSKDVNIRHYGNNGQALYFYASSANIIFYDKLKDIQTPKAKAVDKDKLKQERLFLDSLDCRQKPEILRFEVRLTKQQSLNAFLSRLMGEKIKGQLKIIGIERRLPGEIEVGIFRMAQEALWNVEHHAKASNVMVIITFDTHDIILKVTDDGVGFDVPAVISIPSKTSQLGLLGMQERAELAGGKLNIQSSPGKGTSLTITIPK